MSDWHGKELAETVGGSGTTKDPYIFWLTNPPSDLDRTFGNQDVARSLGDHGFTHVWLR
ncbi:hypothetical protein LCI18_002349 [Fusarium solani-melongenae]|uniref:Uncharacterized protein n=1 Tax=Fusarium solani subsp. cucurbitae TaxID=2747967 RepID=A0ACD3YR07_FUSSC|nr:hypothetical protein LCI18_002349 [Fusarium solani-melongenae]